MKFLKQSILSLCVVSALLPLFFVGMSTKGFAFSVTVTGDKAIEFKRVLQLLPYTSVGTGTKVVYVFGRPTCSSTTNFYLYTGILQPEYEFRWVIEPNLFKRNDCAGLFETRSQKQLEEIFFDKIPVPAKDKKSALIFSEVTFIAPQLLGEIVDIQESYMLPVLAFHSGNDIHYISANNDFFNRKELKAILSSATAWDDIEDTNFDTVIKKAANRTPASGKICAKKTPIQAKLLPHEDAPGFITELAPNRCWTIRQSTADGWLGVQMYQDPNLALGYVKKGMGTIQ